MAIVKLILSTALCGVSRLKTLLTGRKKGALIGITGRIQTRNYNNQQGQRVYVTEVVAEQFQLLESKGQGNQTQQRQSQQQAPDFSRSENINPLDISDDDLPF